VLGFDSRWELGIFLFSTASRTTLGLTHLHLVPRSKNASSYTSTPPMHLHGMVLIKKSQGQLYLIYIYIYMGSRVRFPAGAGNFSLHHRVQNGSEVLGSTQPPIQWVPGAFSLGVKRPGCEDDHSPPSSAEVKECVELYLHSPNAPSWRGDH
jgi:hypothetical protein